MSLASLKYCYNPLQRPPQVFEILAQTSTRLRASYFVYLSSLRCTVAGGSVVGGGVWGVYRYSPVRVETEYDHEPLDIDTILRERPEKD